MDKVKCKVLKNYSTEESGKNRNVLRIVKWGNNGKPMLEKRNFFLKDEEWTPGKAKGFTYEDFKIIGKNNKEIKTLLKE